MQGVKYIVPQNDLPRGQSLWRLNERGLLELRREPGRPLRSEDTTAMLNYAIDRGWWRPAGPRWRKPKPMPTRLLVWLEERDSQQAKSETGNAA